MTVRALYNVVADRQEVVDLVAARMIEAMPVHDYAIDDWQDSVRKMYREARAVYRAMPRATLISLDETITPTEVPVKRMLEPERQLAFLVDLGLSVEDAMTVRGAFLVEVFGFVLLIDYRFDRSDEMTRQMMSEPVPLAWLDTKPEVEAPLARAAAALRGTPDDLFDALIERAIRTIDDLRQGR
ncbi:TetR family transcriptional regulator [Gordonia araii NBRC 100433]|nr:TetR family transcriptional regulator [Gordonia araii NBRC 100433]